MLEEASSQQPVLCIHLDKVYGMLYRKKWMYRAQIGVAEISRYNFDESNPVASGPNGALNHRATAAHDHDHIPISLWFHFDSEPNPDCDADLDPHSAENLLGRFEFDATSADLKVVIKGGQRDAGTSTMEALRAQ
ncbi:hypothetical protein EVAR_64026_1 [Eumeta japonica]|uniref:Uncharacterized protein n=1 Tax=Eumeta variegata TaxID=151549 RepID=A0A4C1Z7C2_EUMVA|nr:hypothetical protein EVAR_64026_1 [Eumeta japonica]